MIPRAMAQVLITREAQAQFDRLPLPIQKRVRGIFERLHRWPHVSGTKSMRGELVGNYRIRTGDYRIVFRVAADAVTVWKIGDRRDVYD